jgi:hypothetical protein
VIETAKVEEGSVQLVFLMLIPTGTRADPSSTLAVSITATEAVTDGGTGYSIQGAVSKAQSIADISAQFYTFQGSSTNEANVNAESTNSMGAAITARTEFVFDPDASKQLVSRKNQVLYKSAFYNRGPVLDRSIDLVSSDRLDTKFVSSAAPGATVKMGIFNSRLAATGVVDEQEPVDIGITWGSFGLMSQTHR